MRGRDKRHLEIYTTSYDTDVGVKRRVVYFVRVGGRARDASSIEEVLECSATKGRLLAAYFFRGERTANDLFAEEGGAY